MEKFQRFPENPFLIPLIVHQTLRNCDFNTLKKCRIVCKLFEQETNKLLNVKKLPIVISKSITELYNYSWKNNISNNIIIDKNMAPVHLLDLSRSIASGFNHRFYCSKVQYLEIQSGPWTISQLKELFHHFPSLKELTLSQNFTLPKMNRLRTSIKMMNLPNLHSLHLNLNDEHLQNLANLEFLSELCQSCPNLCEITCDCNKFSEPGHSQTTIFSKLLFRTLLDVFGNDINSSINLSYLNINVDLRNEDLDLLQKAKLPLKSLHLPVHSVISIQTIDELLSSMQSTLIKLKITYRSTLVKLPSLENIRNLKQFSIHGTGSEAMGLADDRTRYRRRSSFGIGFGPMSETTKITNLIDSKKVDETGLYKFTDIDLDLDRTIYYIFNVVPSMLFSYSLDSLPLKNLQELQLNSVYYIPKDVFNMAIFFPNLRQLKMSFLDDSLLQSIITNFPHLEVLEATQGFFTDTAMTGVSFTVQDIFKNFKVSQAYNTERLREFPSILSLSSLKRLELGSPRVTNFGIINGLVLCQSVQDFILNFPQMDDKSLVYFAQNTKWDSLTIKSGTFSDALIKSMNENQRKFSYQREQSV